MVAESDKIFSNQENLSQKKTKSNFNLVLFIYRQLTKDMLPSVSADVLNCCSEAKNGDLCQDMAASACSQDCKVPCSVGQSCENQASCKIGCCYDKNQGLCSPQTRKVKCEIDGGIWKDSPDCNVNQVPECKLGCCVLGSETDFVTADRCALLASSKSKNLDFRAAVTNEMECVMLSSAQEKGACLLDGGGCKINTAQECYTLTGKRVGVFFKNALCTAGDLNTSCQKTEKTMCVDGKDEVYFQDSCGNAANIYDSTQFNNNSYWEKIILKENSCGNGNSNGNAESKTCGNCQYTLGSKCKDYKKAGANKPNKGDFICADLSCENAPANVGKKDRRNLESWCVYDGSIGVVPGPNKKPISSDVVGSRHYRYSCVEGEVKVEGCQDYRNEICVESVNNIGSEKFSTAACKINQWQKCIDANSKQGGVAGACTGDACEMKNVVIDKFRVSLCTPKYPEGFDLSPEKSETSGKMGEQLCGMATRTCVKKMKQTFMGKCVCEENCACDEPGVFTQQMNDLCLSLGDCGGYVNVAGEYTDGGYKVKKVGKIPGEQYKKYASPVEGQRASPGNVSGAAIANVTGIGNSAAGGSSGSSSGGSSAIMGLGAGAAGIGFLLSQLASTVTPGGAAGLSAAMLTGSPLYGSMGPALAGFGNALLGFGIGMLVGSFIAKALNLSGFGSILMSVGFGFVGISVASLMMDLGPLQFLGPIGWIIGIILIIISLFFGSKKCKPIVVEFTCKPWTQPIGGAKCDLCNKDPLKPCSKYKCTSLGTACQFMNEGTGKELCKAGEDDGQAPIISPWQEILNESFIYTNITEKGFSVRAKDGKCVEVFTPILLGIKTNEASQCRVDMITQPNFESMENDFGDSNLFAYNHSMGLSIPSAEAVYAELNDTNVSFKYVLDKIGNIRFYTRCRDVFGNFNPTEYIIDICTRPGPDRTAPTITKTIPENNGFVKYNTTTQDVQIYTNEPATCRYSKQDKNNYSNMENSFTCQTGLNDAASYGWLCSATFTNLSRGENKFYIRCKDQPWLEGTANESNRNENKQNYIYVLKVTENPLRITSLVPNGTMSFGDEPIVLDLEADTSGGADGGKAKCEFSFDNQMYSLFSQTYSTISRQHFNMLTRGNYNVNVKCEDSIGNNDSAITIWNLEVDSSAPSIIRVYNSGGSLFIMTNENSECKYSTSSCSFNFVNGTSMSGGISTEHSADWIPQQTYYIKCKDIYGHEPDRCSITVEAYNIE
jgi:hypothetical protein